MRSHTLWVVAVALLTMCLCHQCKAQDNTVAQLNTNIAQCRHTVDSLQSLSPMDAKVFYTAKANLDRARASLFVYLAKADPKMARYAYMYQNQYKRTAMIDQQKAEAR